MVGREEAFRTAVVVSRCVFFFCAGSWLALSLSEKPVAGVHTTWGAPRGVYHRYLCSEECDSSREGVYARLVYSWVTRSGGGGIEAQIHEPNTDACIAAAFAHFLHLLFLHT